MGRNHSSTGYGPLRASGLWLTLGIFFAANPAAAVLTVGPNRVDCRKLFERAEPGDWFYSRDGFQSAPGKAEVSVDQKRFLTLIEWLGLDAKLENGTLSIRLSYDEMWKNVDRSEIGRIFSSLDFSNLKQANLDLHRLVPDPGKIAFEDWHGHHTFQGTIQAAIEEEIFYAFTDNSYHRPYRESHAKILEREMGGEKIVDNPNWSLVARIPGEKSLSKLPAHAPTDKIWRELQWSTRQDPDRGFGSLVSDTARIAVTYINGEPAELEAFVSASKTYTGKWRVLKFKRSADGTKWVRVLLDDDGATIEFSCMSCHGYGKNFGPTPKKKGYVRPEEWFSVERVEKAEKLIKRGRPKGSPFGNGLNIGD